LSLGLETSLDLFSQVSVLVLGLEPSSLALDLGLCLGTWDHKDSVFVTHEAWNWDKNRKSYVKQLVYLRCNNKL